MATTPNPSSTSSSTSSPTFPATTPSSAVGSSTAMPAASASAKTQPPSPQTSAVSSPTCFNDDPIDSLTGKDAPHAHVQLNLGSLGRLLGPLLGQHSFLHRLRRHRHPPHGSRLQSLRLDHPAPRRRKRTLRKTQRR